MKIIAVYPGRFQPFHKGHAEVYKWLKKKFGNCTIATSNKVEPPKSPFNFQEKTEMMKLAGVTPSDIVEVRNPYIATEILKHYDGSKCALVFAVSEKDMQEDPRFSFKPTKSGAPSYLQPFPKNPSDIQGFGTADKPRGYVITTPTFQFKVLGEPMKSATELRKQFAEADDATKKAIIKDLYGAYSDKVFELMSSKIKTPSQLNEMKLRFFYESIEHDDFGPMLDSFTQFASSKLGLKKDIPYIEVDNEGLGTSFGGYNPAEKSIKIATKNRHPMDVFRTLAHELVHHKQNLDGRIKDVAKEGSTGSDIENEANSEAGKIMRWFAKENPNHFKLKALQEGINDPGLFKAVFLAGGPGSGKDYILNQTLAGHGMQEINQDLAFEYLLKKNNLDPKMPDSERAVRDIVRGKAKNMAKEQQRLALAGRKGIIINGTADDPAKIAKMKSALEELGYNTKMVFVNTSDEVSKQRNIERGNAGGRTVPENIRKEKWDDVQKSRESLHQLFGDEHFHPIDNSEDLRKAPKDVKEKALAAHLDVHKKVGNWIKQPVANPAAGTWIDREKQARGITDYRPAKNASGGMFRGNEKNPKRLRFPSELKEDEQKVVMSKKGKVKRRLAEISLDEKFKTFSEEHGAGDWGTKKLTDRYKKDTPGQYVKKVVRKKVEEDNNLPVGGLPANSLGPTYTLARSPAMVGSGIYGIAESIEAWANREDTVEKYTNKYGDMAQQKLAEAVEKFKAAYADSERKKKTLRDIRESSKEVKEIGLYSGREDELVGETTTLKSKRKVVKK